MQLISIMIANVACFLLSVLSVESILYTNITYEPADRQLLDFRQENPLPIGLWTKNAGDPVDIRDTLTINSDQFNNQLLLDTMLTFDGERIPERLVHAKGTGAFGYFEVTNDVSKYTYADVFNGIGKKTPLVVRFSNAAQGTGGTDVGRELKGMAIKFYTKQGNLDFICYQTPVYLYRDPIMFWSIVHTFKKNPQTNLMVDATARWDIVSQKPIIAHTFFWTLSDYGRPDGFRRMDAFPIHTFEIANKDGETHYVRFNFRTEQGFRPIFNAQAAQIQGRDMDYYTRDLYNAINQGNFPSWRLEMDVMTREGIQKVDYDPFDVTRLWKNGTFTTVQIGRLTLNRNVDNQFRDVEQGAFNPSNLVPGIPGPKDFLFRARRVFYKDTQNHRLGRNHHKIYINMPLQTKTYVRDGTPPTRLNMGNAPNYYPNSFNGPAPFVDTRRPKEHLIVLERNAVDLEPLNYFYNNILADEGHKQRFIDSAVMSLIPVTPPVLQNVIKLMYQIDPNLGRRITLGVQIGLAQRAQQAAAAQATPPPRTPIRNTPTAEVNFKDIPLRTDDHYK